jgi:hypothetical protein
VEAWKTFELEKYGVNLDFRSGLPFKTTREVIQKKTKSQRIGQSLINPTPPDTFLSSRISNSACLGMKHHASSSVWYNIAKKLALQNQPQNDRLQHYAEMMVWAFRCE